MDRLVLATLLISAAGGCVAASPSSTPAPDAAVLHVRNSSTASLSTTVCAPTGCSRSRLLHSGRTSSFLVRPGRGSRAVVTAKRGDEVVAQHPVDISAGAEITVEIDISRSPFPTARGGGR